MARKKKSPRSTPPPPASPWQQPALGGKHRRTLEAIFERPARKNIAWGDFVSLMSALGAVERTDGGSAHSFTLNRTVGVFHRPHPGHDLYGALVKRIRTFLIRAGVRA